jgi:malonyl-ACP O-methyltransferase BioC
MIVEKNIVERSFTRHCGSYCRNASVQRSVASRLARLTSNLTPMNNILEVGCGTGFLTQFMTQIHQPANYYINDISSEMVNHTLLSLSGNCVANLKSLPGDAEVIPFPSELDGIVSSSVIQWFCNPGAFFQKAANSLHKGGVFAVSTFGEMNFSEINTLTGIGLPYPSADRLKEMLEPYFEVGFFHEDMLTQWFDSPLDVLDHIRKTGVGGVCRRKMGCTATRQLLDNYEKHYSSPDGRVSLTWNPIIIIATKK